MEILVFKDIKNKRWTLWNKSKTKHLGYKKSLVLNNCKLFVDNIKRKKVLKTNKRFPHAWIIGELGDLAESNKSIEVTYNPFKNSNFMVGNKKILKAKKLMFSSNGKVFK